MRVCSLSRFMGVSFLLLVVAILTISSLSISGCAAFGGSSEDDRLLVEQIQASKRRAEEQVAQAQAREAEAVRSAEAARQELEQARQQPSPDPVALAAASAASAKADAAAAEAAESRRRWSDLADKVNTIEQTIKTNDKGEIDAQNTLTSTSAALPYPWNMILGIGGPLVLAGVAEFKRRQAVSSAQSLVRSVDNWMQLDPAVMKSAKEMDPGVRDAVRAVLTPQAAAIIDDVSRT